MKLAMWTQMVTLKLDLEIDHSNDHTDIEIHKVLTDITHKFGFDHFYIEDDEE